MQAGFDLPAAIGLANDSVDSSKLRSDSGQMIEKLRSGKALDSDVGYRFLPAIVPASLQQGSEQNNLAATVATLAKMYQEQAEARLNVLPAALSPVLLLIVTSCVGMAVVASLFPIVRLLNSFMAMR